MPRPAPVTTATRSSSRKRARITPGDGSGPRSESSETVVLEDLLVARLADEVALHVLAVDGAGAIDREGAAVLRRPGAVHGGLLVVLRDRRGAGEVLDVDVLVLELG